MSLIKTTETLRNEVEVLKNQLRDGEISNTVMRSMMLAYKFMHDSLKLEIEAARLGAAFNAVPLSEAERNKQRLRRIA